MILLHSINLFRLWLIKTDFVLTTLATQNKSQIFPQHIAPETSLQHVCNVLFYWKNMKKHVFLNYYFFVFFFCIFCQKKQTRETLIKTGKKRNNMISRNIFSIKNQMQVIPVSRNPRDKKQKKMIKNAFFRFFFYLIHFFSLFVHCFHFCSLFVHFCSFLCISFHFLNFPPIENHLTTPDHWHVDPLSFASLGCAYTVHLVAGCRSACGFADTPGFFSHQKKWEI